MVLADRVVRRRHEQLASDYEKRLKSHTPK
jgi:hypothetical protein